MLKLPPSAFNAGAVAFHVKKQKKKRSAFPAEEPA